MAALHHWRDIAIEKSEAISDAWEVTKAYAARIAEWVLFMCMIINILEILPDLHLPAVVSSTTLAVQVVSLDVAGFGLASMADHAQRMGNMAAAKRARTTGYCLIGIMLATLFVVTTGILWPGTLPIVAGIEKILILARVLMTVIYGHVIHGLRRSDKVSSLARVETVAAPVETVTAPAATNETEPAEVAAPCADACQADVEQSGSDDTTDTSATVSNRDRILAYRLRHPDASKTDVATALSVSARTVDRYWQPGTTDRQQALRVVK